MAPPTPMPTPTPPVSTTTAATIRYGTAASTQHPATTHCHDKTNTQTLELVQQASYKQRKKSSCLKQRWSAKTTKSQTIAAIPIDFLCNQRQRRRSAGGGGGNGWAGGRTWWTYG